MNYFKSTKAYTLVEVLVVIALLGIVMPAVFSILYVILQQQMKIYELTETKRQGDYIMNLMKEKIMRDGNTIIRDNDGVFASGAVVSNICHTPGASFTSVTAERGLDFVFVDANSNQFQYVHSGNNVRFRAPGSPNIDAALNSARVTITNFQISCIMKTDHTAPMVSFSYTATFNRQVPNPQLGTTALQYQTKVKLR